MRCDKRAVSAVVATVLIILITIAAITIIWIVILPMIKDSANFDALDISLTIDVTGGYTYWDVDVDGDGTAVLPGSPGELCLQVKRGSDELGDVLYGIKVIMAVDGGSNVGYWATVKVPNANEAKQDCFALAAKPQKASISPIWEDGTVGAITSEITNIPDGGIGVTTPDSGSTTGGHSRTGRSDGSRADTGGPGTACVQDCAGLSCGLDPVCGVSCGSCGVGQTCGGGACIDYLLSGAIGQSGVTEFVVEIPAPAEWDANPLDLDTVLVGEWVRLENGGLCTVDPNVCEEITEIRLEDCPPGMLDCSVGSGCRCILLNPGVILTPNINDCANTGFWVYDTEATCLAATVP